MKRSPALWRSKALDAAVIVTVRPEPSSLIYSANIAGRLRAFGGLEYFKRKRKAAASGKSPSSSMYRALFDSREAAEKAAAASPFTVEAYHNLPPAKSLDPFNVLGLQQRKQPEAATFECEVTLAETRQEERGERRNGHERVLVVDERSASLYKGLLEAEVPLNLLDGLASTISNKTSSPDINQALSQADELSRKGRHKDDSLEDFPPIRKHLTGGLARRKLPKSSKSN